MRSKSLVDAPAPAIERSGSGGFGNRMSVDKAMQITNSDSPSEALHKLKRENARYNYLPHIGAKQKAKALRRLQKARAGA